MQAIRLFFYRLSAFLSGICLITMTLLILSQIAARSLGVIIPSSEDFAGWLLSATVFFGLAYTFNSGGHIRVTILLSRLGQKKRTWVEGFNLSVGILIAAYLAYYTSYTLYESYIYQDVSDTYLAVPMWMVQTPMAVGSVFFLIAMLDSLFIALRGGIPEYINHEDELERVE